MRFSTAALAIVCPLVGAMDFISPSGGSTLIKETSVDVKWRFVDTDPEDFSIYLWNFATFPPFNQSLALDVQTPLGAYTVRIPCSVNSGPGFQL